MNPEQIEHKLAAARTRLILDKPFLGALVLRLPLCAADQAWCRTTATDARKLYYNPDYIEALRQDELQFVLAHEALHCALSHFARRQHRLKHRWDLACDFAINPLLVREGFTPPPSALVEERFEGLTAEEIYPCLDDLDEEKDTLDQHVYDNEDPDQGVRDQDRGGQGEGAQGSRGEQQQGQGGSSDREQPQDQGGEGGGPEPQDEQDGEGSPQAEQDRGRGGAPQPPPLSAQERETLGVQWQQRLASAAQQALQAGKLGGAMARMVDFLLQPQLPWRMLLARYVSATARDDYSYTRPSTRRGEPAIFPSLRSAQLHVVVALDVSGSVSEREMSEFLSEVDAIKGQIRARITLHACDSQLAGDGPWYLEPWEDFELPRSFQGGGGTRFTPVFDWVQAQDSPPDLLLYFTDAKGEFPALPPPFPVIWLVKGRAPVPWGQRIQLN